MVIMNGKWSSDLLGFAMLGMVTVLSGPAMADGGAKAVESKTEAKVPASMDKIQKTDKTDKTDKTW